MGFLLSGIKKQVIVEEEEDMSFGLVVINENNLVTLKLSDNTAIFGGFITVTRQITGMGSQSIDLRQYGKTAVVLNVTITNAHYAAQADFTLSVSGAVITIRNLIQTRAYSLNLYVGVLK